MTKSEQDAAMPRRAYSYERCSAGIQAKGDTFRRQGEFAEQLAADEGWYLDDTLSFTDSGKSGFHSRNLDPTAALSRFLDLVNRGRITPGSVLIVENLDRLSRAMIDEAYDLFRRILKADIWIATREPRRIYKKQDSGNMLSLLEPLFIFSRAHEESQAKSMRVTEAWRTARRKAVEGRRPHQCRPPGWIRKTVAGYELVPERAAAVRRLFELTRQGFGFQSLARYMAREKQPSISATGRWDPDAVREALTGRAAVGEYQPRRRQGAGRIAEGPPIPAFYPKVVEEEEWLAAQAAIAARRHQCGRPCKGFTNLFVGLVFDATTGRRLSIKSKLRPRRKNKPRPGKKYHYLRHTQSSGIAIPYGLFEDRVLAVLDMLRPQDVLEPSERHDEREHRIAALTMRQTALEHRQRQLVVLAADPTEDLESNREARRAVGEELNAVAAELKSLKLESRTGRAEALTETQTLHQLRGAAQGDERAELDRRIKAALPSIVKEIRVQAQRLSERRQIIHVQIFLRSDVRRYFQLSPSNLHGARPWDLTDWNLRQSPYLDAGDVAGRPQLPQA